MFCNIPMYANSDKAINETDASKVVDSSLFSSFKEIEKDKVVEKIENEEIDKAIRNSLTYTICFFRCI